MEPLLLWLLHLVGSQGRLLQHKPTLLFATASFIECTQPMAAS